MSLPARFIKTRDANSPPSHVKRSKAMTDALNIQELLMIDIKDKKTKPAIRAQSVRAWEVIEERKRILRGIPLPGQLRPEGMKPLKHRKGPSHLTLPSIAENEVQSPPQRLSEAIG